MTTDDILRAAIECQLITTGNRDGVYAASLVRFATLIRAAALAEQPAEQEPVAYLWTNIQSGEIEVTWDEDAFSRAMWHRAPLYTAPKPAKPAERVPLTDREVGAIMEELNAYGTRLWEFARAIERAHGIGVEP